MSYCFDDDPPLHTIRTKRIPEWAMVLSAVETLPPWWVNVHLYAHDRTLGRELYVVETCPGILHFEARTAEIVLQDADPDGNVLTEFGDEWDDHPVVIGTETLDQPYTVSYHANSDWRRAFLTGGYLGSCEVTKVRDVLAENGFANAILKPEGWTDPDDEGGPW